MMTILFPVDLFWTVLQPIRQRHVAMCKIDCIVASTFLRCDRIVLRQHQAHDLTKLDIIEEKLYVDRVWRILCRAFRFVFDEIVFADHFHIRVFDINAAGSTKGDSD